MEYADMSDAQLKRVISGLKVDFDDLSESYKLAKGERNQQNIRRELDRVGDELLDAQTELTRRKQERMRRQSHEDFEQIPASDDEFEDVGGQMTKRGRDPRTGRFVSNRGRR